jgi:hypothetical protein
MTEIGSYAEIWFAISARFIAEGEDLFVSAQRISDVHRENAMVCRLLYALLNGETFDGYEGE